MAGEISEAQFAAAIAAMNKRMLETPTFTFYDVYTAAGRAAGTIKLHDDPCYRLGDRYLQKQRRAGNIALDPTNRRRWVVTPAGRSALEGA